MQSNFFNSFFSYYMILNYFIQPIFMVVIVIFLYKISKRLGNIEKYSVSQFNKPEKTISEKEVLENNEDNQ